MATSAIAARKNRFWQLREYYFALFNPGNLFVALFARRTIQRMVNEIGGEIARGKLKNLVTRLNECNSQSIHAQYEIALVLGLMKLGDVDYEPDLGGASRIDILFKASDSNIGEFLADVTCISQESLTSRAPYEFLIAEFRRLLEPHDIGIAGFHFAVRNIKEKIGDSGESKVRLKIPGNNEITRTLEAEVPIIAESIKDGSRENYSFPIDRNGLEVEITYTPGGRYVGGAFRPDYLPGSLKLNPVYSTLEGKADQINKSGYTGPKGIFLCDAGSSLVRGDFNAEPYSLENIFQCFFNERREISFVCTVYSEQAKQQSGTLFGMMHFGGPHNISGKIALNPNADHPISDELVSLIASLPSKLPETQCTGLNAQNWIDFHPRPYGKPHTGGYTMTGDMVKISVRALQELLAGQLSQEDFLITHGFGMDREGQEKKNPFEYALTNGRLIEVASVEGDTDSDDDWITFEFGDPDPAISKIKLPDNN